MFIRSLLAQRAAQNNPIHVGIIGTGKFRSRGWSPDFPDAGDEPTTVIADINLAHARHAYTSSRVPADEIHSG